MSKTWPFPFVNGVRTKDSEALMRTSVKRIRNMQIADTFEDFEDALY